MIRKMFFVVMMAAFLALASGVYDRSLATVVYQPPQPVTISVSGSIDPTGGLPDAYLLMTTGGYAYSVAIDLGPLTGGMTTTFSSTSTYWLSPSVLGSLPWYYTVVGLYNGQGGVTAGLSPLAASTTVGLTDWNGHFGAETIYWPESLVAGLIGSHQSTSLLEFATYNQGAFMGQLLGNQSGSPIDLVSFTPATSNGSATVSASQVPVPAALLLFAPGLAGLVAVRRRLASGHGLRRG
jgi:hypothetical protein